MHGQFPYREMWFFGADENHRAYRTQLAFDRLRYRMLPYTYSLAAAVTQRGATPMRPLVMDFREDPEVLGIGDQFLFGPSLLVNPVTTRGATRRDVYLPGGARRRGSRRRLVRLLDGRCTTRAAGASTRPPRTSRCRSTSRPARSCRWGRSCSTRARSRPTR